MRRIRDPLHGFVQLSALEGALIDAAPLQRLRRIHQLGLTHYVYPGAEHSRFTHAIGAMHVAGLLAEALRARGWGGDVALVRAAALVHDVGHPPFSHAGERGQRHEWMTWALVRAEPLAGVFRAHGVDPEAVVAVLDGSGDTVAGQLVAGQLDADRMDYLLRDARACGVQYGEFDLARLVETLVVTGDGRVGVRRAGLHAAEGLLLARYSMFQQVYFHRTRRILDLLLEEVLPDWPADPAGYLDWDDYRAFEALRHDPRPAAQAVVHRHIPPCVAEVHLDGGDDVAGRRAEADALADAVRDAVGDGVRVDSSARLVAFRPDAELPILEPDGAVSSIFTVSPVLRRMDPRLEVRRVYVPREAEAAGRAAVERFRARGAQLRLF